MKRCCCYNFYSRDWRRGANPALTGITLLGPEGLKENQNGQQIDYESWLAVARSVRKDDAASDEANKIVKMVEHVLVSEIAIGVSATSDCTYKYRRRDFDNDGNPTEEEVQEFLAFGRVDGVYSICVEKVTYRKDEHGVFNEKIDSERTAWSVCDRETRLRTFERFPELIERIIFESKRLAAIANRAAATVSELIADDGLPDETTEAKSASGRTRRPIELETQVKRRPKA